MLPLAPLMTPERLTTPRLVLPSATVDSLALCDLTTPSPVPRVALVVAAAAAAASVAVEVAVEVVVAASVAEVVVAVVVAAVTSAPSTAPSLASLAPRSPLTKMV